MTTSFALKIFFEIGLVLLIVYGYKNEDRLIAFESELFAIIKFVLKKYVFGRVRTEKTRNKTVAEVNPSVEVSHICYTGAQIREFPVSSNIDCSNVA